MKALPLFSLIVVTGIGCAQLPAPEIADDKAVELKLDEFRSELKRLGRNWTTHLKGLGLDEKKVRTEIADTLFYESQANSGNLAVNNMSLPPSMPVKVTAVRARHILISTNDASGEKAWDHAMQLRKQILDEVEKVLSSTMRDADVDTVARARVVAIEKAFLKSLKESACPSRTHDGDVGWFTRRGMMVDSFADAAFRAKAFELEEPVKTQFGYHLILVTDRMMGRLSLQLPTASPLPGR